MAGKLAGRYIARPIAGINLTPLVPVLLSVFVVVMVADPAPKKALSVDALQGSAPGPADALPWVSVEGGGRYSFSGEPASKTELLLRLQKLAAGSGKYVLVRADPDVSYGEVAIVTNAITAAGLRVSFISEEIS